MDDIAIVKSMHTDAFNHAPAQILMNTGSQQFGRHGRLTTCGLGSVSRDLPAYVVFSTGNWGWRRVQLGSGVSPTVVPARFPHRGEPSFIYRVKGVDQQMQRDSLDTIKRLNQKRLDVVGDPEIAARISAFEMAYRMQTSAPDLMDIAKESKETLEMYGAEPGKPTFANACLLARRLVERGVRFVQIFTKRGPARQPRQRPEEELQGH